jgi:hypothetical protein
MTKPIVLRDSMHYAYGTELKDMQGYMNLKIPSAPNLTKIRLDMSQTTQKLPLTQLHDKLLSFVCVPFSS